MDNDKIDQHSDEIEVESEEKERGKKIEIDEDRLPSRAMAIHEHIRQDGEKELERDAMALLWSAIAAGLSMGASLLAKGIFHVELEGVPGSFLLENLGFTTVGVKDLVVVQTKDAVLIADRNAVQDVKKVVEQIKADGRHEHRVHREVYRPWGKYDSIDAGDRYQVKRITVKPGEGLSVQMHHHRAEHWVVVAGTAKVTIDGDIKLLGENESIYIPLGATHCLENPGKIPLDLIEVRSGSYLEEDDVVRFADRYGRV